MTVCTARIDLGFLLETSSTAMRNGNRYYTRFLRKIVQVFTITKDTTRVGIVTYATRTYGNIAFTGSYTRRLVYNAISRIRQLGRGRRLGKALTYARTYLFKGKPQCGRRRILIVLTAGGSTDKVRQAREGLQKAGVEIFVVGVGGVSPRTLMQVATDRQHIFKIQFAQLHTIVNTLKDIMCYSPVIRQRKTVAIYYFNGVFKNRDASGYANPPAELVGVYYSRGPDTHKQGALSFRGTRHSYVLIPNNGCLDTRSSMTILFWLYAESTGPLVHFDPNGLGVHVWIVKPFPTLFVRFMPRSGKTVPSVSKRIPSGRWNYVAASYNHKTGLATLWLDSFPIAQRYIGRFRLGLATDKPIAIGYKPGDRRKFRGKISCLQIFNYAANRVQIRSKKKQCFTPVRTPSPPIPSTPPVKLPRTLAVYPFDKKRGRTDISRGKNPPAVFGKVVAYGEGPDSRKDGSFQFSGRKDSYIVIPNDGRLDAKYSITVLIWAFPVSRSGVILTYNPAGKGFQLRIISPQRLQVILVERTRRTTITINTPRPVIQYKAWNYIGVTYSESAQKITIYVDSKAVATKTIGKVQLNTRYPIRLGGRGGGREPFRGRLFCLQVYSVPLNAKQINEARKRCFLREPITLPPQIVTPTPPPKVCTARIDLGFLIEATGTVMRRGSPNYRQVIIFLRKIVSVFRVSRTGTRIGIVTYTSRPKTLISFSRSYSASQVYYAIRQIRKLGGRSRLGNALTYAKTYLFRGKPQCGRRRILMVLMAGSSVDQVRRPSFTLKAAGVEIFAVNVGSVSGSSLLLVATDKRHVFAVGFRKLYTIAKTLKDRICYSPGKLFLIF
ncbi:uncharacterized protein LOC122957851 [Acropora millepora]|uniref:uncharacterized protein LOC122957851 n=1 Tax=Acropora millepora TaxID=45264 RepID=UPI001CF33AF6|nr:uncharacterized protein LOC122957851 [Acropora millepora]